MARYARVECLLRELELGCRRIVSDDSRAACLAEDVRCEIRRLEVVLEAAPDEMLPLHSSVQMEETVRALEPLLLELQLSDLRSRSRSSPRQDVLAHYRPHLDTLHELLRPSD